MTIKVEYFEAKTKWPELLLGIQAGNRYTIIQHGVAVADLVPTQCKMHSYTKNAVGDMLSFMQAQKSVSGINLKALIHCGRS